MKKMLRKMTENYTIESYYSLRASCYSCGCLHICTNEYPMQAQTSEKAAMTNYNYKQNL